MKKFASLLLLLCFFSLTLSIRVQSQLKSEAKAKTTQAPPQRDYTISNLVGYVFVDFGMSGSQSSRRVIAVNNHNNLFVDNGSGQFAHVTAPDNFVSVDINSHSNRCGVSHNGKIYYGDSNNVWTQINGWAKECAIADDHSFMVIGFQGRIYNWTGSGWDDMGVSANKKLTIINKDAYYYINGFNQLVGWNKNDGHVTLSNILCNDIHVTADNTLSCNYGTKLKMFRQGHGWTTVQTGNNFLGMAGWLNDYLVLYPNGHLYRTQTNTPAYPFSSTNKYCRIQIDKKIRNRNYYINGCATGESLCTGTIAGYGWEFQEVGSSDTFSIKSGHSHYLAGTNNHQIKKWSRSSVGAWEKWRFVPANYHGTRWCIRNLEHYYYIRARGYDNVVAGYQCAADEVMNIECRDWQ